MMTFSSTSSFTLKSNTTSYCKFCQSLQYSWGYGFCGDAGSRTAKHCFATRQRFRNLYFNKVNINQRHSTLRGHDHCGDAGSRTAKQCFAIPASGFHNTNSQDNFCQSPQYSWGHDHCGDAGSRTRVRVFAPAKAGRYLSLVRLLPSPTPSMPVHPQVYLKIYL